MKHFVYYTRQFSWRLHRIVVILVRLVTAWFMQQDGTARNHRPSMCVCVRERVSLRNASVKIVGVTNGIRTVYFPDTN
jgi:hypothetical protein